MYEKKPSGLGVTFLSTIWVNFQAGGPGIAQAARACQPFTVVPAVTTAVRVGCPAWKS